MLRKLLCCMLLCCLLGFLLWLFDSIIPMQIMQSYFNVTLTELDEHESQIIDKTMGNQLCSITSMNLNSSYFTINRGLWIILPYKECIVSYSKDDTFNTWYDERFDRRKQASMFVWNNNVSDTKSIVISRKRSSIILHKTNKSDKSNKDGTEKKYCDGVPLYDVKAKLSTVYYLPHQQCYYHIFTEKEKNECLLTKKSIFFLGDSTMQDLAFVLIDENGKKWDHKANKFHLEYFSHYIDDNGYEFELFYSFFPPPRSTGVGLTSFRNNNTIRYILKNIILESNAKIIIFNSLLHDMVNQERYNIDTPTAYYDVLQELWLFLFTECNINILYLWSAVNPTYRGLFKNLIFYYGIYIRTFINAANMFIIKYPQYKEYVKLIDTAHVSDGHRNDRYSDGVHYGIKPREYGLNTSLIVEKMTIQIVLNQLCPNIIKKSKDFSFHWGSSNK